MAKKSSTKNKSTLKGTLSADVLIIKHSQVTVKAGKGNDKITVSKGANNIVHGDAGNDQITVGKNAGKGNKVYGDAGNDTIKVNNKYGVTINGGAGNDKLYGGKGNDTFIGGKGKDTFFYANGGGKDIIKDYASGQDTLQITGGSVSKAAIAKNNKDLVITVGKGKVTLKNAADKTISMKDTRGSYTVSKTAIKLGKDFTGTMDATKYMGTVRTVDGSVASKVVNVTGNAWNNTIYVGKAGGTCKGGNGNDTIHITGSGKSTVYGDAGNDVININGGNDSVLYGNAGTDTFIHASGSATIKDYTAGETLTFNNEITDIKISNNSITMSSGINGSVTVENGAGKLTRVTEKGREMNLTVLDDSAHFYGGEADDIIALNSSKSSYIQAHGGEGNDSLYGSDKDDLLDGEAGDDRLYGGAGDDRLNGSSGNDRLYGGAGDDLLWGGTNNDTLYGEEGNDTLSGDAGNDTLYGGAGDDTLQGGDGDDVLYGGTGTNVMYGNAGSDKFYISEKADNTVDVGYNDYRSDTIFFDKGATGTTVIKYFNFGETAVSDVINLSPFKKDSFVTLKNNAYIYTDGLHLELSNGGTILLKDYTQGAIVQIYGADGTETMTKLKLEAYG